MAFKIYTETEKQAMSVKAKAVWADPEKREALSAKLKTSWTQTKRDRMALIQNFKYGKVSVADFETQLADLDKQIAENG